MERLAKLRAETEPDRPKWEPRWEGGKYAETRHGVWAGQDQRLDPGGRKRSARQLGKIKADPGALGHTRPDRRGACELGEEIHGELAALTGLWTHRGPRHAPNYEWGYAKRSGVVRQRGRVTGRADDLVQLGVALRALGQEYRLRQDSDAMTDYYDTRGTCTSRTSTRVSIDRDFYL